VSASGAPPESPELRDRNIGRMILSLGTDRPWSQYFCCMAFGNAGFAHDHPIATKRFLRATLMQPTSARPSRIRPRNSWSIPDTIMRYGR
jgi:hypothetical protein